MSVSGFHCPFGLLQLLRDNKLCLASAIDLRQNVSNWL